MTHWTIFLALAAAVLPARSQIHADFTISSGGDAIGTFRARLDYDKAPRTCANFIGLASGQRPWVDVTTNRIVTDTPYYDGLIFHRLIHDFVIQGGSSNGVGTAGSGYVIQDEFHPDLRHSGRYFLSMAKANEPGTGNSQFFITLEEASFLDDKHSVFGEVIDGREIIDQFADPNLFPTDRSIAGAPASDPNFSDRPETEIVIESIAISGPDLASFDIHDPALELPTFADARPRASRDAAAETFTTTYPRKARHDYLYAYSFDLQDWLLLPDASNLLSLDAEPDSDFTVTGASFDRLFARIGAVDYSFLENPSADALGAGSQLTFTSRSGITLTLQPDGADGGTWSDSNGSSGELAQFSVTDAAPATGGNFSSRGTQARFIPLLNLNFTLDAPGGPAERTGHQMTLDFRTATSGWSDGRASNEGPAPATLPFLHAFTLSPAP
jgi:peptidyl-prolyl cis-trans isomerase A (cyclophilin A)